MLNIATGPNGIFLRLDTWTVRCGDFTRDASVVLLGGTLHNRHGEELRLTDAQRAWLKKTARKMLNRLAE